MDKKILLVEYKAEAFKLFVELLNQIRNDVVSFAFKFFPHAPEEVQAKKTAASTRMMESKQSSRQISDCQQRQDRHIKC
ncbi:MAG: hypothetical protein MZV64_39715 [Ignavibacteriales bacterium]|nr:hypothetical protein [Ignavibacteriales bacterium]